MRATLGILVAASVLTLGCVVIAFIAAHTRSQLETQLAAATAHNAKLRTEVQRLQRGSGPPPTSGPESSTAAAFGPAPAQPATKPEASFPPRTRPPGLMDFARNDPQLWNAFIASKRVEFGRMHLPLLQRLNLSRAQRERFKDILTAEVARGCDLGAAADAQGLSFDDPAIVALREESNRQRDRELTELLGPTGFQAFGAYQRALPIRGFVDGLAVQLAATAPLSPQQADQLETALAAASAAYRKGKPADPGTLDWTSADERAREILTPEQFAAWQLGVAHNPMGGSRRALELQAVYRRAVQRMKEADDSAPP